MTFPAAICLTAAVYAAGSIPTLLSDTQPPACVRAGVARAADAAYRLRKRLVLDAYALVLILQLDPAKGAYRA